MASTFVNDLRLEEIGDGEHSTTWGATTNTNLELIAEAFSFGTEAITTNADTHTTTIADGSTDPGRSIFLKYTGTLDSACTITIGPNTVSKLWFIENATSGSQNIIISQGSGANVTIANGQTKVVYSDGAGSGAAIVDALQDLSIPDLFIDDDLTVGDDVLLNSDGAIIKLGADADVTLTHVADTGVTLASGTNATTLQVDSNAADENAAPKVILNRTSDSPAANDIGGQIEFKMENDNNEQVVIGRVNSQITTITDGSEAGQINLGSMVAGAVVDGMNIAGTTTSLVSAADNANAAPILNLKRTRGSGTAADNDIGGQIDFLMNDAGGNETTVGRIKSQLITAADSSEDSSLTIETIVGGSATAGVIIKGATISGTNDTDTSIDFEASDVLTFNTGGSEAARINGSQQFFIGATTLHGNGFSFQGTGVLTHAVASGSAKTMTDFRNGGSTVGEIRTSTTATSYLTSSDYRLKENVSGITDGIVRVKQLKPSRFNFIADKGVTLDGFLAHEAQSVVPESVAGTKDEMQDDGKTIKPQGIDQAKLVPLLTAALQEAISKIEVLETKVAALEAK